MKADDMDRAVQTLRTLANAATPGPWVAAEGADGDGGVAYVARFGADDSYVVRGGRPSSDSDTPYVALMHPDVGLALADLLEDLAIMHADTAIDTTRWPSVQRLVTAIEGGAA